MLCGQRRLSPGVFDWIWISVKSASIDIIKTTFVGTAREDISRGSGFLGFPKCLITIDAP